MADPKAFQNKNVLITGGIGFIGSNLARRLLSQGAKITLVDSMIPEYGGNMRNIEEFRKDLTVNISDVRDPHAMSHLIKGQDYLFNLAGQTSHLDSMTDPLSDLNINAAAQLSILECCRKNNTKVKIVFASTRQLYGKPDYLPVDENHPIRPVDVNGINKLSGEWYHLLYNNVYGIHTTALRLTNTFGPGMRVKDARQTFLGIWIRNILENKPIKVFGDGKQKRDFNYVDEVVDALLAAALSDETNGKVFNLGNTEVVDLQALSQMLVELRPETKVEFIPFPPERKAIDIGDYYSDFGKIQKLLNWAPNTKLKDGLKKTLEYYTTNLAHYL